MPNALNAILSIFWIIWTFLSFACTALVGIYFLGAYALGPVFLMWVAATIYVIDELAYSHSYKKDVLSDYTTNLEDQLKGANALADQYS